MDMKPPIFVLGNPRSGTTLLRLILNNHRNIVVPPECGFAVWWHEKYGRWNSAFLDAFLVDVKQSRKIETWELNYEALRDWLLLRKPGTYAQLVSSIYEFYGQSRGRAFQRWGDKNNFHVGHVKTLHHLFPKAYFLHIVRDGRDVACSYRKVARLDLSSPYAPNLPTEICAIAQEWVKNISNVLSAFDSFDWKNTYELKYEALASNPEEEVKRLCDFLKEPFDENMLCYYERNRVERQEPIDFLPWKEKTLEKPTTSEIGKFHYELTHGEIKEFESIARGTLIRYGYITEALG